MSDAPAVAQTEDERQAAAAAAAEAHRARFAAGVETPAPVAETPTVHEKPEHVPAKFFNAETGEVNYEAWNKAHTELETRFHQGAKPTDGESEETPASDKPPADGEAPETPPAVLETPAAQRAAQEYEANQEISADTYAALEAQGIDRSMVDAYIAGQEAKASILTNAAYEPAGGPERYAEMITWAKANLDEPSRKAFNTQVSSGDPDVIRNAVTALASVYGENATVEAGRVGGTPPSSNSSTFESRAEMTAAINKVGPDGRRLYDTDQAYRNEVARMIGNTRKAGRVQL